MKNIIAISVTLFLLTNSVYAQEKIFEKTVAFTVRSMKVDTVKKDTINNATIIKTIAIYIKDTTAKEEKNNLKIKVEKYNNNNYIVSVSDYSFKLYDFDYEAFKTGITKLLEEKLNKEIADESQITNLYDRIKDADTMEKEAPVAGELIVKKEVPLKIKKTENNDTIVNLKINNYIIKIENGLIQNISLYGTIKVDNGKPETIELQNKVPIGFSTIRDYRSLSKYNLIIMGGKYKETKIQLDNFITYLPKLRNYTRDYAPYDIVIDRKLSGDINNDTIILNKEPYKKILDAKAFTDLMAFSGDNPNGIIQFEVEKRMPFFTQRHSLTRKKHKSNTNIGYFQYIKPKAVYSKIENTNKYLELKIDNTDLTTNIIELYKHETFHVGTDLNLFIIDAGKSNINLDLGVAFSRIIGSNTSSDSTSQANKIPINSIHSYAKIGFDLMPDERYGMSASYTVGFYNPLNTNINYEPVNKGKDALEFTMQNIELSAFVRAGKSGKMFFRYRLTGPAFDFYNNYSQVQVGYSWDIMSKINSEYNKK